MKKYKLLLDKNYIHVYDTFLLAYIYWYITVYIYFWWLKPLLLILLLQFQFKWINDNRNDNIMENFLCYETWKEFMKLLQWWSFIYSTNKLCIHKLFWECSPFVNWCYEFTHLKYSIKKYGKVWYYQKTRLLIPWILQTDSAVLNRHSEWWLFCLLLKLYCIALITSLYHCGFRDNSWIYHLH